MIRDDTRLGARSGGSRSSHRLFTTYPSLKICKYELDYISGCLPPLAEQRIFWSLTKACWFNDDYERKRHDCRNPREALFKAQATTKLKSMLRRLLQPLSVNRVQRLVLISLMQLSNPMACLIRLPSLSQFNGRLRPFYYDSAPQTAQRNFSLTKPHHQLLVIITTIARVSALVTSIVKPFRASAAITFIIYSEFQFNAHFIAHFAAPLVQEVASCQLTQVAAL